MWRRPLFGRRYRRSPQNGLLISLILGVGLACALIASLNIRLRPIMEVLAETEVRRLVGGTINGAVSELIRARGIDYSDLVSLDKDETGHITALTGNTAAISEIQTTLSAAVLQKLDGVQVKTITIPFGNLTGVELLSGHGPSLKVKLVSVSSVSTQFKNEFTAAGINQTLHRILLEVTVDVSILLPGETIERTIVSPVNLAETVIVGNVPQQYFSIGNENQTP